MVDMSDKELKEEYFQLHKRRIVLRTEMNRHDSIMFDYIQRNQEAIRKLIAVWGQPPFEDGSKLRGYIDYYVWRCTTSIWGLEGLGKRYQERRKPMDEAMTRIYQRAGGGPAAPAVDADHGPGVCRVRLWEPAQGLRYIYPDTHTYT